MTVKFDISNARRTADFLRNIPKNLEVLQARARATLARRIAVEARRDIQTEYNLPAARVNEDISVRQTSEFVELVGKHRPIGRINFGGSQGNKGVTYQISKTGPRKTMSHSFIARGLSGNTQIFSRIGKPRLPIRAYYGPSVAQMLRKEGRPERLAELALAIFSTETDRLKKI